VIFTTAYNEYALTAIKMSALDYLLKPIEIEELNISIKKALDSKADKSSKKHYQQEILLSTLNDNMNSLTRFHKLNLPHATGFNVVNLQNLIFISADNNYTVFHLDSGEQ